MKSKVASKRASLINTLYNIKAKIYNVVYANTCTEYVRNESYSCAGYDLLKCYRFWRKSFSDFGENRFLILKKIVFWFEKIIFWFWRKSFSDFEENRFLIFSWFYNTIYEAHLHTKKNVCKSCVNRVILTRFLTRFIPHFFFFGLGMAI